MASRENGMDVIVVLTSETLSTLGTGINTYISNGYAPVDSPLATGLVAGPATLYMFTMVSTTTRGTSVTIVDLDA